MLVSRFRARISSRGFCDWATRAFFHRFAASGAYVTTGTQARARRYLDPLDAFDAAMGVGGGADDGGGALRCSAGVGPGRGPRDPDPPRPGRRPAGVRGQPGDG